MNCVYSVCALSQAEASATAAGRERICSSWQSWEASRNRSTLTELCRKGPRARRPVGETLRHE